MVMSGTIHSSLLHVQIQEATVFVSLDFVVWHYYTDSLEGQSEQLGVLQFMP